MHIRTLTASDVGPYRKLMLEAYAAAADAFTTTAEERALEPESWWVKRIADPKGLGASFGAIHEGKLVGTVAVEYSVKPKLKHAASIIGMYVHESARGKGIGRALLLAAMRHASQRPGIEIATLTVTEGNAAAVRLYESAGFHTWGIQPRAIATSSGYKGRVHMWCALASHAVESGD
jgi:ribosomal protein S18 acetylase RimI-like enzyme